MTTDPTARLAEFLSIGDSKRNLPGVRIRDAATMLVIDRSETIPKVLMGRRHHGHKFMPGMFVFPGGRVEIADRRVPAETALDPRVEARLQQHVRNPSPQKSRGFALAAIREVFEETGLALGISSPARGQGAFPPTPDPRAVTRSPKGATAKGADLGDAWAEFRCTGVMPDLSGIHFIARAVTPPGRPRRFDTRFFAVDAHSIAARVEGAVGPETELVELVWLPIADTADLDMPGITRAVIEELKLRTAAGFTHDLPVPFYRMQRGKRVREFLP